MSTAAQLARIRALLKITNLPLKGDRRDGFVKYCLLDADDKDLVIGNNYNDPLYGFTDAEFPELVILSINALPALLRERDRLRIALDATRLERDDCKAAKERDQQTARAEKAESKLAALLADLLQFKPYATNTGPVLPGPWISADKLGVVIAKHSLNGDES